MTEAIEFEEARRLALAAARVLDSEWVALDAALGRVLAEPLTASWPLPIYDHAAMDGYALRSTDMRAAQPVSLPIAGMVAAGDVPVRLPAGQAMRIMTGGRIPEDADAVVRQEDVRVEAGVVVASEAVMAGSNLRRRGEDVRLGERLVEAGEVIDPDHVMALASFGHDPVRVRRRPKVVIITCGDELVEARHADGERVVDTAGPTVVACCRARGADARLIGPLPDSPAALELALRSALDERPDLLVTVGGASVGDRDYMRGALDALGMRWSFTRVLVKPGKPTAMGQLGATLVFVLPGNPGAAKTMFAQLVSPVLDRLQGRPDLRPIEFVTERSLARDRVRTSVVQVELATREGRLELVAGFEESSGRLAPHLRAQGSLIVPPGSAPLPPGSRVELQLRRPPAPIVLPRLALIGASGSGKTTLIAALLTRLANALAIGVIKHGHHFELDKPGKDSDRFRSAGARAVVVASPELRAMLTWPQRDSTLDELVATLPLGLDLLLVEGFKHDHGLPAIEVHRGERPPLCAGVGFDRVIALVTDAPALAPAHVRTFAPADIDAIEALVLEQLEAQRVASTNPSAAGRTTQPAMHSPQATQRS